MTKRAKTKRAKTTKREKLPPVAAPWPIEGLPLREAFERVLASTTQRADRVAAERTWAGLRAAAASAAAGDAYRVAIRRAEQRMQETWRACWSHFLKAWVNGDFIIQGRPANPRKPRETIDPAAARYLGVYKLDQSILRDHANGELLYDALVLPARSETSQPILAAADHNREPDHNREAGQSRSQKLIREIAQKLFPCGYDHISNNDLIAAIAQHSKDNKTPLSAGRDTFLRALGRRRG
jgi:hypothetical protein